MASLRSLVLLSIAVLLMTACGEVREDLGLGRNPPDEFAVVEHPPLSMPPDFGLRPPRPGAPSPLTVDTSQTAKDTLFNGTASIGASAASPGEQALLNSAGASKASPDIRATVDQESAQKVVASPHLVERLTDWSSEKPATTVDPAAEAERLKQVKDNNQPVTQGATPVIEKQQSGWLGL